jgi:hypothetical protein
VPLLQLLWCVSLEDAANWRWLSELEAFSFIKSAVSTS